MHNNLHLTEFVWGLNEKTNLGNCFVISIALCKSKEICLWSLSQWRASYSPDGHDEVVRRLGRSLYQTELCMYYRNFQFESLSKLREMRSGLHLKCSFHFHIPFLNSSLFLSFSSQFHFQVLKLQFRVSAIPTLKHLHCRPQSSRWEVCLSD